MRRIKFAFLLTLLVGLWAEKYPVFFQGKQVGWEEVDFRDNCMESRGNYSFIPMQFKMRICYKDLKPVYFFFSGTVQGTFQRISAKGKGEALHGTITAAQSTFPLSIKLAGPTLVLPNGPLSPYLWAYRLLKDSELGKIRAYIIPQTTLEAEVERGEGEVSLKMAGLRVRVGKNYVEVPAQGFSLGKPPESKGRRIEIKGSRPGVETVQHEGACLIIKREQAMVVDGQLRYCPGKISFKGTLYSGLFSYSSEFEASKDDFKGFVHPNPFLSLPILQREWEFLPERFLLLLPPSYFYPHPVTTKAEILPVQGGLYYLKISSSQGFFVKTEAGRPVALMDPINQIFVNPRKFSLKPPSYSPLQGKEVKIEGLCGTLLTPQDPVASVVFITGSGPQDRNENSPGKWGLKTYLFARIADFLFGQRIASLRTDDRGVGCSAKAKPSLDLYVQDVVRQIKFMRDRFGSRPVYLIGHSLGSLVALMASSKVRVDGLILLGAYGERGRDLVMYQLEAALRDMPEDYRKAALKEEKRLLEALSRGELSGKDRKILATPFLDYLRELMSTSPLEFVKFAPAKVLIINGDKDKQAPPSSAKRLCDALLQAGKKVKFLTIPGDHLFLPSPTGEVSLYGYLIYTGKEPNPELCRIIGNWILKGLQKRESISRNEIPAKR